MQLLVLGMHRSGTSAVTRLINMMGAYIGPESVLLESHTDDVDALWEQNRKGFWERRDVVDANDLALKTIGGAWNRPLPCKPEAWRSDGLDSARKQIHKTITLLESHRPWVIKDPRLCLTLPLWREQLEVPVGIIVSRNPHEVAASLQRRNGMPLPCGLALWDVYYRMLNSSLGDMPVCWVSYENVVQDPVGETKKLFVSLETLGVRGLTCPPAHEITAFIDSTLHRERAPKTGSEVFSWGSIDELEQFLHHGGASDPPTAISVESEKLLTILDDRIRIDGELLVAARDLKYLRAEQEKWLQARTELIAEVARLKQDTARQVSAPERQKAIDEALARERQLGKLEAALATEQKSQELLRTDLDRLRREFEQRGQRVQQRESESERIRRESQQRSERLQEREAELRDLRAQLAASLETLDRVMDLFGQANMHWWWRMGLRLRRVLGGLRLMSSSPQFPYDRARKIVQQAGSVGKKKALTSPKRHDERSITSTTSPPAEGSVVTAPKLAVTETTQIPPPVRHARGTVQWRHAQEFSEQMWAPKVDVIVTVHNALDDVRRCLESVVCNSGLRYSIIVVNDGSDAATTEFLIAFARVHPKCILISNDTPKGYTIAANQGLRESKGDYSILLNSDTIVPRGWLTDLLDCAQSDSLIGIVGPLSNAASYQSVPDRKNAQGDWAVNALPEGFCVDDMAALVRGASARRFPRVPFVNGFCYLVKRAVIETIGYLDESSFPHGYGEENDYSLRARAAGFELAIADQAYVFHAKSKSFGHERRQELSRVGQQALKAKHGTERLTEEIRALETEPALMAAGDRVRVALDGGDYVRLMEASVQVSIDEEQRGETPRVTRTSSPSSPVSSAAYAAYIRDVENRQPAVETGKTSVCVVVTAMHAGEDVLLKRTIAGLTQQTRISSVHIFVSQELSTLELEVIPAMVVCSVEPTRLVGALNEIFGACREAFGIVLRAGDVLADRALADLDSVCDNPASFTERIGAVVVDDDVRDSTNQRSQPEFRPGWSPALLLEHDYIDNAAWFRIAALRAAGGFIPTYTGEWLRDALLRLDEAGYLIEKLDHVDLHRSRRLPRSVDPCEEESLVRDHAERRGWTLRDVEHHAHGTRPSYDAENAMVSIVIPFKDKVGLLCQCVESILHKTAYLQFEILLVDNQSVEDETRAYLASLKHEPRVRIVSYERPFNYSRLNNFAAKLAHGQVLLFLNNDTEVISPRWLHELAGDAMQEGVGSVGALLLFADGRVQHAGIVVGLNGLAGHIFSGEHEQDLPPEYLRYRREASALTAACLAIRKDVFERIGGFCEEFLITGNDVELGLRLRDYGYRNVLNPAVKLFHYERSTRRNIRVKDIDIELSLLHYQPYLDDGDPYFNRHWSLNTTRLELADGRPPIHVALRRDYEARRTQREGTRATHLGAAKVKQNSSLKLPDEEVVVYDVSPSILRENAALMQRFYRRPYLEPKRVLWFVPHFDHILRGGIYTIFRTANYFSERAGTHNVIVLYGGRKMPLETLRAEVASAFPNLRFELLEYSPNRDVNELPESDAAFCTLWTSAYYLVRYNKCRAKFSFLQDYEPCFYAAGTVFGLIEQTYRFGFIGIANTPGVADVYRKYNPWVDYFVPAVDRTIYRPSSNSKSADGTFQIVFYGRPANSRNAFRLGIEALKRVKAVYGNRVSIVSVGAEFDVKDYEVEGIIENRGILPSLEDVAELYRHSDLGLVFMFSAHPSYQPFEFMASGCVTVTNDNPRNHWLLKDGENAALVEPTVSCIADKIIDLLEDTEVRERIREGGLTTVQSLAWADAMEKVFQFVSHPWIRRDDMSV